MGLSLFASYTVASAESEPEPESESEAEPRPRFLPEELSRSVVVLECESSALGGTCDVHIIGTAHVSSVFFHPSVLIPIGS